MDNELFEKAPIPKAYFSLAMPVVLTCWSPWCTAWCAYLPFRIVWLPLTRELSAQLTEGEKQTNDCIG